MFTLSVLPILAISEKFWSASASKLLSALRKIITVHSASCGLAGFSAARAVTSKQLHANAAEMVFIAGGLIDIVFMAWGRRSVSRLPRRFGNLSSRAAAA